MRFLAQSAVPDARMAAVGEAVRLVDVVTGSAAILAPDGEDWLARGGGPVRLRERVECVLDDCDAAGAPGGGLHPSTCTTADSICGSHSYPTRRCPGFEATAGCMLRAQAVWEASRDLTRGLRECHAYALSAYAHVLWTVREALRHAGCRRAWGDGQCVT